MRQEAGNLDSVGPECSLRLANFSGNRSHDEEQLRSANVTTRTPSNTRPCNSIGGHLFTTVSVTIPNLREHIPVPRGCWFDASHPVPVT
jgi:hypothetical protein